MISMFLISLAASCAPWFTASKNPLPRFLTTTAILFAASAALASAAAHATACKAASAVARRVFSGFFIIIRVSNVVMEQAWPSGWMAGFDRAGGRHAQKILANFSTLLAS